MEATSIHIEPEPCSQVSPSRPFGCPIPPGDWVGMMVETMKAGRAWFHLGAQMMVAGAELTLRNIELAEQMMSIPGKILEKNCEINENQAFKRDLKGEWTRAIKGYVDLYRRHAKAMHEFTRPIPETSWDTVPGITAEVVFNYKGLFNLRKVTKQGVLANPKKLKLVIPPQAGHGPDIVHYGERQSLLETALNEGNTVYVIDQLDATEETKNLSIDDYILGIHQCYQKITENDPGQKMGLEINCQAGWMGAIYASLFPETVESMIIAAAPLDAHAAKNNKIYEAAIQYPMEFYQTLVQLADGKHNGIFQFFGFKLMDGWNSWEEKVINPYLKTVDHVDDPLKMKRTSRYNDWDLSTKVLPGTFYLWIVEHIFKNNELTSGDMEVLGRRVDLGNITCDVLLLAGAKDDVTDPLQVFAAAKYFKNARSVRCAVVPAGHIGCFMGTDVIANYWPSYIRYMDYDGSGTSTQQESEKALNSTLLIYGPADYLEAWIDAQGLNDKGRKHNLTVVRNEANNMAYVFQESLAKKYFLI